MEEQEKTLVKYLFMTAVATAYIKTINNHSIKISKNELLKIQRKEK